MAVFPNTHAGRVGGSAQIQIEQWLAAMGTPQQVALRSRIVLAAGRGKSESAIAAEMNVNRKTVRLWCERFVAPEGCHACGRSRQAEAARPPTVPNRSRR